MINNLKIGDQISLKRTFSSQDVELFSRLSSDTNPIHLNHNVAKASIFKKRIVHGMLVSSLFSAIIGTKLLGPGSIYLSQSLIFQNPIFLDEEITAIVKIIDIEDDKSIISCKTKCYKEDGKLAIDGEAVILFRGIAS